MIVCICHRISDREIARGVRAGMDFSALQLELGVATQCGNCESRVRSVVAQCSFTLPVAAIERAATDPAREPTGRRATAFITEPTPNES